MAHLLNLLLFVLDEGCFAGENQTYVLWGLAKVLRVLEETPRPLTLPNR